MLGVCRPAAHTVVWSLRCLKKKSINELILSEKTEMVSYVANGQTNEIGETISWLDANPMKYPSEAPKFAWIGSLINEPSHNEIVNCKLFWIPSSDDFEMPHYPFILRDPHSIVCVQVVKPLKSGEELLLDYGVDDEVRNSLGYELYGRTTCAKSYTFAVESWTKNAEATNKKRKANKQKKQNTKTTQRTTAFQTWHMLDVSSNKT